MKSLIRADNISVVRQQRRILDNVSLEIAPQEFVTIVGPNGAGKSMLLKCLLNVMPISSGNIKRQTDLSIGYVPQRISAEVGMPIQVARFLKLHKKTTAAEYDRVVIETDIESVLERQLDVLSGGEMQRVLLARALLGSPQLLILDEPAQNLDVNGQLSFYKRLDRVYQEREISVLMVSHDLHIVLASTQRVICLHHHICCTGQPAQISQDPSFIALFGEHMGQMMRFYGHHHEHSHDSSDPRPTAEHEHVA